MPVYSGLTDEQKNTLQTFTNLVRSWCIQQKKSINQGAAINTMWNAQILAILAVLDDNSIIPNTSGLAGSMGLDSDSELATIRGQIDSILTSYNTEQVLELWAKAAGAGNLI